MSSSLKRIGQKIFGKPKLFSLPPTASQSTIQFQKNPQAGIYGYTEREGNINTFNFVQYKPNSTNAENIYKKANLYSVKPPIGVNNLSMKETLFGQKPLKGGKRKTRKQSKKCRQTKRRQTKQKQTRRK